MGRENQRFREEMQKRNAQELARMRERGELDFDGYEDDYYMDIKNDR